MTPPLTKFFPWANNTIPGALPQQGRHPTCPIPRCPARITTTGPPSSTTPPKGHYSRDSSDYVPNLGHIRFLRLSRIPLRIVELCGGLATGLEALLIHGYEISSYAWVDTEPDAHTAASHRISSHRRPYGNGTPDFRLTSAPSPLSSSTLHSRRECTSSSGAHWRSRLTSPSPTENTFHRVRTLVDTSYALSYTSPSHNQEGSDIYGSLLSFIRPLQPPCHY